MYYFYTNHNMYTERLTHHPLLIVACLSVNRPELPLAYNLSVLIMIECTKRMKDPCAGKYLNNYVSKMQVYVWIRTWKQPDIFTHKGKKDVLKVNR